MKIKICMLLGLNYDPKMRIVPQIGIASHITNFGHEVSWVVSSGEISDVLETTVNGVRVFVVPCTYSKSCTKIVNKIRYFKAVYFRRMRFVFQIYKKEKFNIVFVRFGESRISIFDGFLALYLKRRYKIPFVFEIVNPIEQSWGIDAGSKHKYFCRFISKIGAYLTIYTLREADLVLPSSKWMLDDYAKKGIKRAKMMPFPNGIDPDRFLDVDGEEIRKMYGLEDSKVVIYVGTMVKSRGLEILIHAFSKVRKSKENVKLLMVGDGDDRSNLEMLVSKLGIVDDVIFTGPVYFHDVPNFIDAADIEISAVPPLDFYKVSSPIKLFEYLALGKPVVANDEIHEVKEVIGRSEGGILVKFEDESFATGILELLNNPKEAAEMGKRGRDWVLKNRSYERLAREIEKRYFDLLLEKENLSFSDNLRCRDGNQE